MTTKLDLSAWREWFDAVEPRLRAFLPEADRWSRLEQTPPQDGPLAGWSLGVKDIINVDGFETRCGSDLPPEVFAGPQASCVTRLLDAGAVVLGKTVTTEFAYYEPGPTTNPHNSAHTPGGSSSGSAAAVAAGLCDVALGSQTQGSVIRPAAFCGCVGFKPTFDRIRIDGVMPFSKSVDTLGFFTRDVANAAKVAPVLLDNWQAGHRTARLPALAVPRGPYLAYVESDTMRSFENMLTQLRDQGFAIRDVDAMPDFDDMAQRHRDLAAAEAAHVHREWFARYGDRYRPKSKAIIEQGMAVTETRLNQCRASRGALGAYFLNLMSDLAIDAWLCPAAPGIAPASLQTTGDPVMNIPWTHAHMPVITIPSDQLDGLPLGLQIAAGHGRDEQLLAWAKSIEAALR